MHDDVLLDRLVTYPGPPYQLADHQTPDWILGPRRPAAAADDVLRDWLGAPDGGSPPLRADGAHR